jgi:POT family proton-dependent oligopeptide transporter
MSAPIADDLYAMAQARQPSISHPNYDEKTATYGESKTLSTSSNADAGDEVEPTMEEMKTLRRVSGKIPWQSYTITFIEFCERFSYYGTTALFVNFIQQPRPYGSRTGNIQLNPNCINQPGWDRAACEQPGGLGQGQQASTGLTTFNQVSLKMLEACMQRSLVWMGYTELGVIAKSR